MNTDQYKAIAEATNRPVVLVAPTAEPSRFELDGAESTDYSAAVERAEALIASGDFVRAMVIKPTGEVMVRIPGLNGVYAEAKITLY